MKNLALFDFDGTLTNKDTLLEFLKFYVGKGRFYVGMMVLSPYLIAYKLGLFKNWKAKEKVLSYFLKGENFNEFLSKGKEFARNKLSPIVKKEALDRMKWHRDAGDRVIVVSASSAPWIEPWTQENKVELICTVLELDDGVLTGRIEGKNCYGPEKVNRICEVLDPDDYGKIYVYGDSRGDLEMFGMGTDTFYRKFA